MFDNRSRTWTQATTLPGVCFVLCSSCVSEVPQKQSASPTSVPATAPGSQPNWEATVTPIEPPIVFLFKQQQIYMRTEGPGHRAKAFADLAVRLMSVRLRHKDLSLREVFLVLGLPDCGDVDDKGAAYIYYFDQRGSKDACIIVSAHANRVTGIGVNASSEIASIPLQHSQDWSDVRISPVK